MKSGSCTTPLKGRDRGGILLNLQKQSLKQTFTHRWLCFQFGGIGRVSSTLNSFLLIQLFSDVYCHLLENLKTAVQEKRPNLANQRSVIFQLDNARPHTPLKTRKKLSELNWDVLPHPPYGPDLVKSHLYLFRSLHIF